MRRTITLEQYKAELSAQGVGRNDFAAICPVCKTVQSMNSLIAAGVDKGDVDGFWSFSCVGRFTNAGEWKKTDRPGRGCNWTLGGLFQLHDLEVIDDGGTAHPRFEIATPEQARQLAESLDGPAEPGKGK